MKESDKPKQRGFTLIELLVVISVIALLSSIVMSSLNIARTKARDARRQSDLAQLDRAIAGFFNDRGYLPRNTNGWCTYISNTANGWGVAFQGDLSPTYISKVPLDPTSASSTTDYLYHNVDNLNGRYALYAKLEGSTGQTYNPCGGSANHNYRIQKQ